MKTIISLGSIFCAAALTVSCSVKEDAASPEWTTYEISADCVEVKTALNGRDVVWEEGDLVACFCHNEASDRYSLSFDIAPMSISGSNAVFEVTNTSGFMPKILMYPSSSNYRISQDKAITLDVPDVMPVKTGNAPAEGLVSIGVINEGQVQMRNVMALLKFSIESDDICRIDITAPGGEPLSGDIAVNLESLQVTGGGKNYVAAIPAEEQEAFAPGIYYVPVPANEYSKGLSVRFEKTNGDAAKKAYAQSYTVRRNRFVNMGQETEWGLVFKQGTLIKDIVFVTENGTVFPFSNKADALEATPIPAMKDVAGKGEKGPFYLVGWPDMPFYFHIQNYSAVDPKSYFTSQGDYGLRFGGTKGDYMTLPALAGYRLTSIHIEEGRSSSYYAVTTVPEDDDSEPEYLTAQSVTISKNTSKTFEFDATKTEVGKPYRLVTGMPNPTAIKKMTLTYKNEEE